jgi:mannose-6-phosphate isomerase-like protein (cupin superfamily)
MHRLLAILVALPLFAADPAGLVVWKSSELKGYQKKLAPKIDEHKAALENLVKFDKYRTMIVHREGDGEAELHENDADLFIVESGSATLVVGGTMVTPRNTAAGEVRGPSINGGERKQLGEGDVVNIPANIPHQVLVPSGMQFTYFVVKEPK